MSTRGNDDNGSDRPNILELLRSNPAALEQLLGSVGDALFVVDRHKNIVFWNEQAEKLTGFVGSEVLGNFCLSGIRCDNCMYGCALFERGSVRDVPVKLLTKDGGILYCRKNAFVLKDDSGRVVGGVEFLRDETELRDRINRCAAQRQTIEARDALHSAILTSVKEGVVTVDREYRITSFSGRAETLTGTSADSAIGRHCHEVFGSHLCRSDCPVRHCYITGDGEAERTTEISTASGVKLPVAENAVPLKGEGDKTTGAVIILEDLSARRPWLETVPGEVQLAGMVGHAPAMRHLFAVIEQVAPTDATILVTGESGTGKEMVARAVHQRSKRNLGPLEAINCAALPEPLLESELFGHVRGAFTGAVKDRLGRIGSATGGTLFLDEIGDMPLSLQAKLLRFLQEREYQRLGENKTRFADVRVVAATNKELAEEVASGRFREDLYYRIKVIPIHLPPLRERLGDVPLLTHRILDELANKLERPGLRLSPAAQKQLLRYPWPGNVRELVNALEYAATMAGGIRIRREDLPADVRGQARRYDAAETTDLSEAQVIERALKKARGNRSKAAEYLGMHRVTLYRKLKKYGL